MIYLDHQATTPLAPEAKAAMLRFMDGADGMGFGNPHSSHMLGRRAAAAVEAARERVAALFPSGGQVIFTSGATEALNMALRGAAPVREGKSIALSALEHSAVYETALAIGEDRGADPHILPVNAEGVVDASAAIPANTGLVAVMQVNNEIGTIQPVSALYKTAKAQGALFVCDAVQAAGKMPIAPADMIAISAHKFYGPKGVGVLWIRDGVDIVPLITGGGQEGGLRSGTVSPVLAAGMGAAASVALERMDEDAALMEKLWLRAREVFDGWTLNGSADQRYHGNINLRRPGLDVARLMADVRGVCFSAGSACASEHNRPSRILSAIGLGVKEAQSSIRLGFGRHTTVKDLDRAAQLINNAASQQEIL